MESNHPERTRNENINPGAKQEITDGLRRSHPPRSRYCPSLGKKLSEYSYLSSLLAKLPGPDSRHLNSTLSLLHMFHH